MPHGFFNKAPWLQVTIRQMDFFLKSLCYLGGEPALTLKLPENSPALKHEQPELTRQNGRGKLNLFFAEGQTIVFPRGSWSARISLKANGLLHHSRGLPMQRATLVSKGNSISPETKPQRSTFSADPG